MSLSVRTADERSAQPPRIPATVADVMRSTPTAYENDHAAAAAYLMEHANATALVVLDTRTDRPLGLITEADIVKAVADGKDLNGVRLRSLMGEGPGAIPAGTNIRDAAGVMLARGSRRLPVTDDHGRIGIVEIGDIFSALPPPYSSR